jgi:hypothetical protein
MALERVRTAKVPDSPGFRKVVSAEPFIAKTVYQIT